MDEKNAKEEQVSSHSDFRNVVIAMGFLVICILALTYGEYNMSKALNKAFDERQMLLDRIEVLEQNVNSVAATGIDDGWDVDADGNDGDHSPSMKDYPPESDVVEDDSAENSEATEDTDEIKSE